jgi:hypothetical protein
MDNIIENNIRSTKTDNDIHVFESKFSSVNKCLDDPRNGADLSPILLVNLREGKKRKRSVRAHNLVALVDGGATDSFILHKHVKDHKSKWKAVDDVYDTAGGDFAPTHKVRIDFSLPEFSESKIITHEFRIDSSNRHRKYGSIGYDVVFGRDLLHILGINDDFETASIRWKDATVPMKPPNFRTDVRNRRKGLKATFTQTVEPKATKEATERIVKILDSNYEAANLHDVAANAHSLNAQQKNQLLSLLEDFEDIFDGTLGHWQTKPVEIELKPGAKPYSGRYYPVPKINKETFKRELLRLVNIGVLDRVEQSEYGTPVFIIPKKEGTVRFLTDFRQVNKTIVRKPYPIPRIGETMQQLEGFQFASALDLNMGYYTIALAESSKDITTIVTEFGKFRYNKLPMGMCISGDTFQAKVNELLGDIEGVKAYIDDILVLNKGTFNDHIEQLRLCFRRIQAAGLKVNAKKCSFGLAEIPYLGYIITRKGIKPDPKKIQGILDLERPKTTTECRALLGLVQYYRDMWQRRSHILTPLTEASSGPKGRKINWTDDLEQAFCNLKKMVSEETLLTYPDWTEPFTVHTDASDYQLGAVISQRNKPIAFFSRRLSKAQRNYTTTEKELLSIVECLKQFRGILFGYKINVFSDHKNLVYAATVSESQRVMRWRLILEEFGPNIEHIAGVDNTIADMLSRHPSANVEDNDDAAGTKEISNEFDKVKQLYVANNNNNNNDNVAFPLTLALVYAELQIELQDDNSKINSYLNDINSRYEKREFDDVELVFYDDRIYVPSSLRRRTLEWYHHYLNHPGGDRLANTLLQVCYWKGLTSQAKKFAKHCKICQRFKRKNKRYGKLPPKEIEQMTPWHTVHIDLIGPYNIKTKQHAPGGEINDVELQLTCMTFIDPATGWFEITQVPVFNIEDVNNNNVEYINKTSARISQLFNNTWLSRYPRPHKVIFDNGSEFKRDFAPLLQDFDVRPVCTTVKNPQANAPVERVHQVIRNMMVTKDLSERVLDYIDPWGATLSSIAWAIRASYHNTLQATPAQLVFGRDMIFNIATVVDWHALHNRKQTQVLRDNIRENDKRIEHEYNVGDFVYVVRDKDDVARKMTAPKTGPYAVTDVYDNGTVRIQRGNVNERINIRRIEPHFGEV